MRYALGYCCMGQVSVARTSVIVHLLVDDVAARRGAWPPPALAPRLVTASGRRDFVAERAYWAARDADAQFDGAELDPEFVAVVAAELDPSHAAARRGV